VVAFTWTIYIKEKQYHFSIWKNVDPLTIYFQLIIIFLVCLIHIVMRFFFPLFWLSTQCQEQSHILEKQNGKRVCVKDEWKCLLLNVHKLVFLSFILCKKELLGMILCNNLNRKFWRYEFLQDFFKIIKYFDQFVISQLRSFSHLENFPVGKEWFLIDPHSGNFYTFEQTRNKLNTNNFLKYYSLVSNVPKYTKDHLKENCVNVNFDILSKKDAYLERIVHSKNVRFVYKGLVNAIKEDPLTQNQRNILFCQKSNSCNIVLIVLTKIWEKFVSQDSQRIDVQ
jgi:hypothetical protein